MAERARRQHRAGHRRQARRRSTCSWWRCCARATCCSRTCPASARRCWPGRSRARSTARSGASSSRPTCCPATSPASRSSTSATQEFEFRPGPIFAQVVLADEINRATPRTQSALLECMEERQVTSRARRGRCRGRSWCWRPRTRSSSRARSRCPRRSSTASCCACDRLPERGGRKGHRAALPDGQPARRAAAGRRPGRAAGHAAAAREVHVAERRGLHRAAGARHAPARVDRARRQPARRRWRCTARRRRSRRSQGRGYVLPDDVKRLAPAVLTHRLITSAQSRLRGAPRRHPGRGRRVGARAIVARVRRTPSSGGGS